MWIPEPGFVHSMRAGGLTLTNVEHHSHVSNVLICNEKKNCPRIGILIISGIIREICPCSQTTWGDKSQSELT